MAQALFANSYKDLDERLRHWISNGAKTLTRPYCEIRKSGETGHQKKPVNIEFWLAPLAVSNGASMAQNSLRKSAPSLDFGTS
jgi:hypothetical protein